MASPAANQAKISENRKKLYKLEHDVLSNKQNIYLTREAIFENRAALLKNYNAVFNGNRQYANANTEAAFRNRITWIKNIETEDQVKINFREASANKAKIEFLEHRSALNAKVNHVSKEFAEINAKLIAMQEEIMAANAEIIAFNKKIIDENSHIIKNGLPGWDSATPDSNAKLIESNLNAINEISKRVHANASENDQIYSSVKSNRDKIAANFDIIQKRRAEILENRKHITENVDRVVAQLH